MDFSDTFINISTPAFNIETDWDNRVGWWDAENAVTSGGNCTSIPDTDGGTALTPKTGSAAIAYTASNDDFNGLPTCSIGSGTNDGLRAAIGDNTTNETTIVMVYRAKTKKNAVFFEWSTTGSINRGPQWVYANGFSYFARAKTVSGGAAEGLDAFFPALSTEVAEFDITPHVAVFRYSATENKINIRINGQRWGEDFATTGPNDTLFETLATFYVGAAGSTGWAADIDVQSVIVTNDYKSDALVSQMENYQMQRAHIGYQDIIVFGGSSFCTGFGVTGDGYVSRLSEHYDGYAIRNECISGGRIEHGTASLSFETQNDVENRYQRWKTPFNTVRFVFLGGGNDISDSVAASTVYTRLSDFITSLGNTFSHITIIGPPDRSGFTTEISDFNDLIIAGSLGDVRLDLTTNTLLGDNSNTTDGTHYPDDPHDEILFELRDALSLAVLPTDYRGIVLWTKSGENTTPASPTNGQEITEWLTKTNRLITSSVGFEDDAGSNIPVWDSTESSILYDGNDSQRLIGNTALKAVYNNVAGFTVITRFKIPDQATNSNEALFGYWNATQTNPIVHLRFRNNLCEAYISNADANAVQILRGSTVVDASEISTCATRFTGSAAYLYAGAVQDASDLSFPSPGNTAAVDADLVILGKYSTSGGIPLNGYIDEVIMYNRDLGSEDITELLGSF